METRRRFIRDSAIICAAACLPVSCSIKETAATCELKTRDPKRALILCYSQTGLTSRYGRLLGCILKDRGIAVDLLDMKGFNKDRLTEYDLIITGSPVFYYDIPSNVSCWLSSLPDITGTPVAAFVSFGGPEGNQHNALCRALGLLAGAGGAAVGMDAFRSIPAYPTPKWDGPNQLSAEHLPNEATYDQVRRFAGRVLAQVKSGEAITYGERLALREFLRALPLEWLNKKAISLHTIDGARCIKCLACVKKCPVAAIDPIGRAVNRDKCLACFGCLNNCPTGAVIIEYRGERLYGFLEYLRRKNLTIAEPREFRDCKL
jgi:ferredoxin/flavodoxin